MKEILISSSALILLVLLLRLLLRGKVRQKLLYAAWLLVALRLLIPIQFGQWSFSLNTLTETVTEHSETLQYAEDIIQSPVVDPFYQVLYEDLEQEYRDKGLDTESPNVQLDIQKEIPQKAPTVSDILKTIWLSGVGMMALWFLLTNLSFRRKAKAGAFTLETDAPVPVFVSTGVPSPCLVRLIRPVIYVTPECAEDPQMLRHVITHETTHLRQWDPIWSFVRCVCLCIYWFNPLVWVAATQSRRDCELSCDESALRKLGDQERIAYGKTLLTMVRSASPAALLNTATSMSESKKRLKERMCFIVKKPRNLLIAAVALTLIIALAAGCAFTGGKPPEETPPETEPTTETTTQPPNNEERLFPVTPVPEGVEPTLVRDGIFYKKDIRVTEENVGKWKCPLGLRHSLRIPQLSVNTNNAKEFNQKIWQKYSEPLWQLSEDTEDSGIYLCDYQWFYDNDIVCILVCEGWGAQMDWFYSNIKGYYYDLKQDRELTMEEYFHANNTTYDQVMEKLVNCEEYRQTDHVLGEMTDCLLLHGEPIAVMQDKTTLKGWLLVESTSLGWNTLTQFPDTQDLMQTVFRKDTPREDLVGTWIAHVKNNEDDDAVSYTLTLKEDGTAEYRWGIYGSDLIASFKGTWKPGEEAGTYVLHLTTNRSGHGDELTYDVTSVQQLRCSEDGTMVQARWSGGTQLFQFYSKVQLLLYRYDSDEIYYDIPVLDVS